MLNSSLSVQRDSEQHNGHSSELDQRKSGILLLIANHKENGPESLVRVMGPQGMATTGGGGLAGVPNLPLCPGWHTQGGKDELTSCRGTVQSAWQKPPVRRKGGRAWLHPKRLVKTVNIQVK